MTKQVQRRRGSSTQHTGFTGADGEISVNTTNKSVHVHDGATAGGFEAARADLDNVDSTANLSINNLTVSGTVDGRDVAADGTKLDGIEAAADVTDATNVAAAGALMTTGGSVTGDVSFGDNNKATFGAGDLEIYHDGNHSYVTDQGDGNLRLRGSNFVQVLDASGNDMIQAEAGGAVDIYHNGSPKIATTSFGAQVTGSLAVDTITNASSSTDVTIDTNFDIILNGDKVGIGTVSPDETVQVFQTASAGNNYNEGTLKVGGQSTVLGFQFGYHGIGSGRNVITSLNNGGGANQRISIGFGAVNSSGEPTTNVMTLNQSGSVGIGIASPTFLTGSGLEVSRSGTATVRVARTGATASAGEFFAGNDKVVLGTATNTHLQFRTNNTERLRILPTGGITFNGDTAAANALSDYEQGAWTPALNGGLTPTGVTASYTKIGNRVFLNCQITVPTNSSSTAIVLSGIPYTAAENCAGSLAYTTATTVNSFGILVQSTQMFFYKGNAYTNYALQDFSGHTLIFTAQYKTA